MKGPLNGSEQEPELRTAGRSLNGAAPSGSSGPPNDALTEGDKTLILEPLSGEKPPSSVPDKGTAHTLIWYHNFIVSGGSK